MPGLTIIETHPIQYHAPVWRELQRAHGIPVSVIYGSDFSVAGYNDREFNVKVGWSADLLDGYNSIFLSKLHEGGARNDREVSARGLAKSLDLLRPEAVLSVGYNPRFHRIGMQTAFRRRIPLLFRAETTDHAHGRNRLHGIFRDTVLRILYARCAGLLHIGARSLAHFRRLGFQNTHFSPYCVDTRPFSLKEDLRCDFRGSIRKELSIRDDQIVIAFSGKLSFRKGPDLLIAALANLSEAERNRWMLLFIGDGVMRSQLITDATRSKVNVRFVGFQAQSRLSQYYHASDLLALPSRFGETWGLVVNEALEHGVPVVVSDAVGCASDLVEPGRTGEIFSNGSVSDLQSALQRARTLIASPETRNHCRNTVADYSVARAASGLAEAYNTVTG